MNKEEIDKWLDNEYGISYTRLEELHDFYFEKYCDLQQENKQLKEKITTIQEELFNLKNMIYKPETREENFGIQRKISSIIKELEILKGDSNE